MSVSNPPNHFLDPANIPFDYCHYHTENISKMTDLAYYDSTAYFFLRTLKMVNSEGVREYNTEKTSNSVLSNNTHNYT